MERDGIRSVFTPIDTEEDLMEPKLELPMGCAQVLARAEKEVVAQPHEVIHRLYHFGSVGPAGQAGGRLENRLVKRSAPSGTAIGLFPASEQPFQTKIDVARAMATHARVQEPQLGKGLN